MGSGTDRTRGIGGVSLSGHHQCLCSVVIYNSISITTGLSYPKIVYRKIHHPGLVARIQWGCLALTIISASVFVSEI